MVYGSLIGASVAFVMFCRKHGLLPLAVADIVAPSLVAGLALGRLGCLLNGCCYGGQCDLPWAVTFPPDSPPFMDQLVHGEMHGLRFVESMANQDGAARLMVAEGPDSPAERVATINAREVRSLEEAGAVLGEAYSAGRSVVVRTLDGKEIARPAATNQRSLPVHPTQVYSAVNAGLLAWLLWSYYPHRRRDGEVILLLLTVYPVTRFLLEAIRTDERSFLGTGLSISQNISLVMLVAALLGWWWLRGRPVLDSENPEPA